MNSLLPRYPCVQSLTRRIFWDSRARVVRLQSKSRVGFHRTMASRSEVVREDSLAPTPAHDLERQKEKENESGRNVVEKDGKGYLSHIERTATEPRDESLHTLFLTSITTINPTTRLFYLSPRSPSSSASTSFESISTTNSTPANLLTWKPGQWIDLYLPGIEKPGGFSITNIPPSSASSSSSSSSPSSRSQTSSRNKNEAEEAGIELAIQKPTNQEKISEQVSWLFQPSSLILNQEVKVRIGGSFTLPLSFPFFSSSQSSSNPPPPPSPSSNLCSRNTLQDALSKSQFESTNLKTERESEIEIKRIIFIAGGMGINPLMSILSYIHAEVDRISESNAERNAGSNAIGDDGIFGTEGKLRRKRCLENLEVKFLYSTKAPSPIGEGEEREERDRGEILFLPRLLSIFAARKNWDFQLFITGDTHTNSNPSTPNPPTTPTITPQTRRITASDIQLSLPTKDQNQKQNQKQTIIYICGPPLMTDKFISYIRDTEGMDEERVVCERWW
ncbi:hypothetical protein OCU04_006343 [Sclerotinia nivalis]|uniref:FAD-binding FR-type domain-containing protein n=1 Tax=Sclerotinia nivalis TaxID=352851 RepID=A0A9X0DJA8_9HELO|nr:hypothetical protein OCU04_006343 [Sclerotinia nivalis]